MRPLLACLVLVVLGACDGTTMRHPCGLPCSDLPAKYQARRGVGACADGIVSCNEAGQDPQCVGEITPSVERCNGIDDNCDGVIDDILPGLPYGRLGSLCNTRGICSEVLIACVNAQYACAYPQGVEWGGEVSCDGLDNDCDGRVDEDITGGFCYTGAEGTSSTEPCHPGVSTCIDGAMSCENQQTPEPEVCDGIDNDCDGITDNTGGQSDGFDLVFILDTSGSMTPYINAVVAAIDAYLDGFLGDPNYRFALVRMNQLTPGNIDLVGRIIDFVDVSTFRSVLSQVLADGPGLENSQGAIYMVCDRTTNPLGLAWREGSQGALFVLTDEPAQDYTGVAVPDVIDTCTGNGVIPFVWGFAEDDLKAIAEGADGIFFRLSPDWHTVHADMAQALALMCL